MSRAAAGHTGRVDLTAKLQLGRAATLAIVGAPDDVETPSLPDAPVDDADAVLAFVRMRADLDALGSVVAAARADRLTWIAYPKAKALGTDLNRDLPAAALVERGLQPVRQVSIDAVWSALRFRPA